MVGLLRKSTVDRVNTSITALALILIIILSSLPHITALSMVNLTIKSSGVINLSGSPTRPLHVDGRWIKDSNGNIVIFKGIHKIGYEDFSLGKWAPEGSDSEQNDVGDLNAIAHNLDAMKAWGANAIRLITAIQSWMDGTKGHRQHMKDICDLAAERGIYVVYCPYSVIRWTEAGSSGQPPLPWPPHITTEESAYIPNSDAFEAYWDSVATELGSKTNVIFELYNEPTAEEDYWFTVMQNIINRIRNIEKANGFVEHLIIVSWMDSSWANLGGTSPETRYGAGGVGMQWVETHPLTGTNLVYNIHLYRQYDSFGILLDQGRACAYLYSDVKLAFIEEKINWVGETLNKPFVCTETGVHWYASPIEEELEGYRNAFRVLNEWQLGYFPLWWATYASHRMLSSYNPITPNEWGQVVIDSFANATTP